MNRKNNILFTIPNFKTAGSQFVLLAIYERLDRSRFQPYILVEKHPDHFPDSVPKEEQLHLTEAVGERSYIRKLAGLLKKLNIDILHSWDYKSNAIEALACKRAGVAYIYTKKNNAWSKRWFVKSLFSKHIVYNNPEMLDRFFNNGLLRRKVSFIPHGVDTNLFRPLPKQTEQEKFTIGCIGVLGPNKNQLFLLQALTQLPEHFQLFLYGKEDKDYKETLVSYLKEHHLEHRVFFKGYIANRDIPTVMAAFHVVVLPSLNEGLPLSIIEAMACGVPVLSSNSGGGARYLLEDHIDNCIFSLTSEAELVQQLLQLEDSAGPLYQSLSTYGVRRVRAHFSIEKESEAYNALYLKFR